MVTEKLNGNTYAHINRVTLCQTCFVLRLVTIRGYSVLEFLQPVAWAN